MKEVFTKDLDIDGLVTILANIRRGEIRLQIVDNGGNATPVDRVGIERVRMKTDLIPPERMRAVLVESAKARLLNETRTFLCTNCWDYLEMIRVKDLPEQPKCPRCSSKTIGLLKVDEDTALPIIEKKGQKLAKSEKRLQVHAIQTSRLIARYGKTAVVALSGRKVRSKDVASVLEKEQKLTDRLYELVLEAERKALSRRFG
uniref:Archaeal ATP-dependent helicase n=1 Tax=uncultured microorganism TaxID=358574 RepID=K0J6M2_9ZZZZ|nr:archaeal ATP-dependent helicase [uncultured microorganism]